MRTVLVIDDDARLRELLTEYLGSRGFEVACAPDGERGLERLRAGGIDLVVLDLMMPGIDGAHTFRALRRLRPDLPILLVSGYDPESSLNPLLRGPRAAFLQKPFRSNELLASINALLEQRTFA